MSPPTLWMKKLSLRELGGPAWLMNTGLVRSLGLCSLQGPFLGFQTPPVSGFSDPSSSMWAWLLLLSSSLHLH